MISSESLRAPCASAARSFSARSRRRREQSGYALLMVCFLAALMIIATWAVVPDLITQAQREKEEEMIWRGQQYARGVRMFYRKNGRFPQSIEDLTEKKTNIRYMRQAYKNPTNPKDGEWRLIYVGPNGQLVGSLRNRALGGAGGAQGIPQGGAIGTPSTGTPSAGAPSTGAPTSGTATGGRIFGGNIIGVGGTVAKPSLKVYQGATNYREWEFIWDPTKDAAVVGAPGGPRPGTPGNPGGLGGPPPPPPPPRPRPQ
jgi:hypothetical protein